MTRFQLSRAKGWRMPAGGVVVARPTKWGNPYSVSSHGRERAVELYREHLAARPELVAAARRELRGKPLGCWCRLGDACHADVLLEVANSTAAAAVRGVACDPIRDPGAGAGRKTEGFHGFHGTDHC